MASHVFLVREYMGRVATIWRFNALFVDREGYLYITLGDRGQAQRLDGHLGKIICLRDDGKVPIDNPLVAKAGARPKTYSLGHRNVKGAALHPSTGIPSIAPSGMAFYLGSALPRWQDDLFIGALSGPTLVRLRLQGDRVAHEERMLWGTIGRVRDVRVGPNGLAYLLSE